MPTPYFRTAVSGLWLLLFFAGPARAQVADLTIQKTGPTSVIEGTAMQYSITISNNGPTAVTNATFSDTFPVGVSQVALGSCTASGGAVCPGSGNYSINTVSVPPNTFYLFSGTIPNLPVDGSVTFTINLNAPTYVNTSSFSNTATVTAPSSITDPDLSTNSSTWNTVLIDTSVNSKAVDIAVIKTVNDPNGYDCNQLPKRYTYTVKWINKGPIDVRNIMLYDDLYTIRASSASFEYPWRITDTSWRSALGANLQPNIYSSTGTMEPQPSPLPTIFKRLSTSVPLFKKGDTITFTFTFTLDQPDYKGCGGQTNWSLGNTGWYTFIDSTYRDTVPANNMMSVESGIMACNKPFTQKNVDIKVLKTVDDIRGTTADSLPKSYRYTVTWINLGPLDIYDMSVGDVMFAYGAMAATAGNSTFQYPWSVSNIVWKSSPGSAPSVPYGNTTDVVNISIPQPAPVSYDFPFPEFGRSVPVFERGDTITMTYTFTLFKPAISGCGTTDLSWDLYNSAVYRLPLCYADTNKLNDNAIVTSGKMTATSRPCQQTDLQVIKTVNDRSGYPCEQMPKSYQYQVKWINQGPGSVDSVILNDQVFFDADYTGTGMATYYYPWTISEVQWSASSGLPVPTDAFSKLSGSLEMPPCLTPGCDSNYIFTSLLSRVEKMDPGDTVTLSYKLNIRTPTVSGCGKNVSWDLGGKAQIGYSGNPYLSETSTANNDTTVISGKFTATATDLVVSKSVNPAIINTGERMSVSIQFYNASGSPAIPATWTDTLPATFQIDVGSIRCSPITGSPPCGNITYDPVTRVLKQEISNMPANSGVNVTFSGTVTSLYTVTEFNKAYAFYSCLDCVPSTNFTQTNYQINGNCDSVFAGIDGDTAIAAGSRDTLYLFSILNSRSVPGGTWVRVNGSGGILDAAGGIFIVNSAITTSVFRYTLPGKAPCPPDTSYVTIRLQPLPAPDTLTAVIPTNSSDTVCAYLPANAEHITVISCDNTNSGTGPHGNWSIDPVTKCLQFEAASIKGRDTLCVTVCDTSTQRCTNTVVIIFVSGEPPIAIRDDQGVTPVNTPVIIPVLTNDISPDQDPLQLCAPPIASQPGQGTVTANPDGTITYTPAAGYIGVDSFQYVICDQDGRDTGWVTIHVGCEPEGSCCALPNAFTPNKDGINDIFRIRCACELEQFYLVVFDRWGEQLYESNEVNSGWDGLFKGERVQADAYAYYLEYTPLCTKKKVIRKGNVTVMK